MKVPESLRPIIVIVIVSFVAILLREVVKGTPWVPSYGGTYQPFPGCDVARHLIS